MTGIKPKGENTPIWCIPLTQPPQKKKKDTLRTTLIEMAF